MKYRNFLVFVAASAFSLVAVAQEQLKHEKKIFVDSDKKVYVNKDLPIYFRVSTSPDASAESHLLPSERSVQYANPMYFDTEGINTLRSPYAIDRETKKMVMPKQDVLFEIYADGIAPVTKFNGKGARSITLKGNAFYGQGFKPEFISTDGVSGIEAIYISINQEAYKIYDNKPLVFEEEKAYSVKYYAVDNVGNIEAPKVLNFNIDISAPVTEYSFIGENKGKVLSSKASIKLTSTDTLSGVDKIICSINEGKEFAYTTPISVSVLSKENSKITYYAVDKLGNKEEPKVISTFSGMTSENIDASSFGYYIDKESPVISMEIEGDKYQGAVLFISERSKVKINATDDKSGVEKVSYSIDNLTLSQTYSDPFLLQKEGKHVIAFAASDYVGNLALAKTQQVILDATAPVSKLSFAGSLFINRDTAFINSRTKFSIQAAEAGSGVQSINYSFDNEQSVKYSEPFIAQTEGCHTLKYNAADQVNNTEPVKEKTFYVDNTPPVIHNDFSVKAIGEKLVRDEKYVIYPSNVMLYIAATDNASGGEKIEYKINGKSVPISIIPIKGLAPGNYEIEVTASDVLKNSAKETIKFAVED